MNFDPANLFGNGFARMTDLEALEQSWKELKENPAAKDEVYWNAVSNSYDLLISCTEADSVPKELISLYTAVHDFAVSDNAIKTAPLWAAVAEALSGLAAYSIVDIPIEKARSLRAFDGIKEYVVDIDKRLITEE